MRSRACGCVAVLAEFDADRMQLFYVEVPCCVALLLVLQGQQQ